VHSGAVSLSFRLPFASGEVFYTLDGSEVSVKSPRYVQPLQIESSARVKSLAVSSNGETRHGIPIDVIVLPDKKDIVLIVDTLGGGYVSVNGIRQADGRPIASVFAKNSIVEVSAHANPGWQFMGWIGDCSSSSDSVSVKMVKDQKLRAVFGAPIVIDVVGQGTVTRNPDIPIYPFGTRVRLEGIPDRRQFLLSWIASELVYENPLEIVVTNSLNRMTGVFGSLPAGNFSVFVSTKGAGKVEVSPRKPKYAFNETVTVTVKPDPNQYFSGWGGDVSSIPEPSSNPTSFSIKVEKDYLFLAEFSNRSFLKIANPVFASNVNEGLVLEVSGPLGSVLEVGKSDNFSSWKSLVTITNNLGALNLDLGLSFLDGDGFFRINEK
jgi:hypothetical protein